MEKVIDFLKYKKIAALLSLTLFIIFSGVTLFDHGFNWGIDFIGGVKTTVKFEKGIDIGKIRSVMNDNKISATVQEIGKQSENEYIIGTKLFGKEQSSEKSYDILKGILEKGFNNIEIVSVETVGPAIGKYLRESALFSIIIVLILIMIYLAFRFEFKYSVGAIVALFHDVILATFFCGITRIEISIPVVAAILTLAGYSVNDTIVIFDRIRENVNVKSKQTFVEIINKSETQSLSRTLLTSLTTMFAVMAIYVIGGEALNDFALVLIFGLIVGTYSTIYIASPIALLWEKVTSK